MPLASANHPFLGRKSIGVALSSKWSVFCSFSKWPTKVSGDTRNRFINPVQSANILALRPFPKLLKYWMNELS